MIVSVSLFWKVTIADLTTLNNQSWKNCCRGFRVWAPSALRASKYLSKPPEVPQEQLKSSVNMAENSVCLIGTHAVYASLIHTVETGTGMEKQDISHSLTFFIVRSGNRYGIVLFFLIYKT